MNSTTTQVLWLACAAVLLGVTVWHDAKYQRIPNGAVLAGVVVGLSLSMLPGGVGIGDSLLGMCLGLAFLLPFYAIGAMGAGDVKLVAAIGAFTGASGVLEVVLFTLAAGGLMAIAWAAARGSLRSVLANLHTGLMAAFARVQTRSLPRAGDMPVSAKRIPYAIAIAIGMVAYVLLVKRPA